MVGLKFSSQSDKFLSKCNEKLFIRISKKLEDLKLNPVPSDAKFIGREENEKVFRIRIGKYRVIYTIKESEKVILISKIDKRERVYD